MDEDEWLDGRIMAVRMKRLEPRRLRKDDELEQLVPLGGRPIGGMLRFGH